MNVQESRMQKVGGTLHVRAGFISALIALICGVITGCDSETPQVSDEPKPIVYPTWLTEAADSSTDTIFTSLRQAEKMTIYSLDPFHYSPGEGLHGWKIVDSAHVPDEKIGSIVDAVWEGIEEGEKIGLRMGCFNPRHAVRGERDGVYLDYIVCYECLWIRTYRGASGIGGYPTGDTSETLVNSYLPPRPKR